MIAFLGTLVVLLLAAVFAMSKSLTMRIDDLDNAELVIENTNLINKDYYKLYMTYLNRSVQAELDLEYYMTDHLEELMEKK